MLKTISVIGNVAADIVSRAVDEWPAPGMEILVDSICFRTGGAAGTTAAVLASMGAPVQLHATIGDDTVGRTVKTSLAHVGVDLLGLKVTEEFPTTISLAFESDAKDRSFISARGHLEHFSFEDIDPSAYQADLVLLTGYFTTPALQTSTLRQLGLIKSSGSMSFFDPGSDQFGWSPAVLADLRSYLVVVDCFVPNAQELLAISGCSDIDDALEQVSKLCDGWLIAKLGKDGCAGMGPNGETFRHSIEPVPSADTTGAGDSFNAGLLFGLAKGMDWSEAARLGSRVATAVLRKRKDGRILSPQEALDFI
ncbi:carbohydrate kinase family protein [Phyllobacterium zundukense]|uniref:Carbohydrate kinase family protein n=1 Tax=Phyllobacterium zundukense TaxID=1867719 RepID=A0ACD4CV51_9HYPH|nr:carbohydrate kinase family protein [Phyllobacterium zundukense]UXN57477.1 carbohydrate kinase family protein [Phyllobacterium zundukense]